MDFITGLLVSTNWKSKTYDSILVIVDQITKMVHYELVKEIINDPAIAKFIIEAVMWHYDLLDSIVSNRDSVFTSKFFSSLCYFFRY